MCTSGGSGGGAVFHMSTGLWMLSPELPPPFRQRSGCFTTARGAPGRSPRSSTGVSTLVDNSTVVIYEKPCETTENQLNMRLRRDPGGISTCCAQHHPQPVDGVDKSFRPPAASVTEIIPESIHSHPQASLHIHPQITPLIHSFLWMDPRPPPPSQMTNFCDSMPEAGGHKRRKAPPYPGKAKRPAQKRGAWWPGQRTRREDRGQRQPMVISRPSTNMPKPMT